jgi:hypothetical protein
MDALSGEELVSVAFARDEVEGAMIQGLLEGADIPSVLQHVGIDGRTLGIGLLNPDGGSRRVMVRASELEQARALLAKTLVEDDRDDWTETADASNAEGTRGRDPRSYGLIGAYARIWAWSLAAMAIFFAAFMLLLLS